MKRHSSHSRRCTGTNCIYKSGSKEPSVQQLLGTGSRIDRLYYGKYLPLRERKLLDKLIRTRAIYDDVRTQLLSASGSSDQIKDAHRSKSEDDSTERSSAVMKIIDLVDRGQIGTPNTSKLSTTCSCCSCGSFKSIRLDKHPRIHRHSVPYEEINKYAVEAKKRGRARHKRLSTKVSSKLRAVRFKAKRVRSAPCLCTLKYNSTFRRQSKTRLNKQGSKEMATSMPEVPKKSVKIERKTLKFEKCFCTLKLGKHAVRSIRRKKHSKSASISCACIAPKDKNSKSFQIRKDSLMLFREKLNRKKSIKDWECDPDACVPEECEPEECYIKIKSKRVGKRKSNKNPSKLSSTDLPRSHVSISVKKKVSHVNVGKRVKKMNVNCMCPTKLTSSGTDIANHTRKTKYIKKSPKNTTENLKIQMEQKATKRKKSSYTKQYKTKSQQSKVKSSILCNCPPIYTSVRKLSMPVSKTFKISSKSTLPFSIECEPNICVSGECDPENCVKVIQNKFSKHGKLATDRKRRHLSVDSTYRKKDSHPKYSQFKSIQDVEYDPSPHIVEDLQYKTESLKSHPSKQAVRIGSTISFNIELHKEKISAPNIKEPNILKDHESNAIFYKAPHKISEDRNHDIKYAHIRSISSQSKPLHFTRDAHRGHGLKRCMCTLKIPKRHQRRRRASSKNTMTTLYMRNVDIIGQMRETQTKPFKVQDTHAAYVTPPFKSNPHSLLPYECEPFFCSPGKCNHIECEKRIKERHHKNKYSSKVSNKSYNTNRSTSILTAHNLPTSKIRTQSDTPKHKRIKQLYISELERSIPSLHPPRQVMRIGSSFSFNIEFSKEKYSYVPETQEAEKISPEKIKKRHLRHKGIKSYKHVMHTTSQTMKTEKSRQTQKFYYPSNILKETGTVTPLGYKEVPSVVMRHESVAAKNDVVKFYHNKATISPYQCKPGACNPREYEEIIRMSKATYRNQYVNTRLKKKKIPRIDEKYNIITPSEPEKQVLRIGSSFSFNIEFYKERQPVSEVRSLEISHKQNRKGNPQRQIYKNAKFKETGTTDFKTHKVHRSIGTDTQGNESRISRCFCTSKLHKNRKRKTRNSTTKRGLDRSNINLKPKYCNADVCDPYDCYEEINKHHIKKIKHRPTYADKNTLESVSNIKTPYNARYRIQSKYTEQTPQTYKAQEQMSLQQISRQAVRIGSVLDFNIDFSKQEKRFNYTTKDKLEHKNNPKRQAKTTENLKTKKQLNNKKTRVENPKKEHKTCNLGPKIINIMGGFKNRMKEVVEKIKKIKLKRSKSQYTMVRVKKPKPGEIVPAPVTAAFFQVFRDKPMNPYLYDSSYRNREYQKNIKNRKENQLHVRKYSPKQHLYRSSLLKCDICENIENKGFSSHQICRVKNDLQLTRTFQKANKIIDSRINSSSKISTHYNSYYDYNIDSKKNNNTESVQVKTSELNDFHLGSPPVKENPFHQKFYVFNLLTPYTTHKKYPSSHLNGKNESLKSFKVDKLTRTSLSYYKKLKSSKNGESVQSSAINVSSIKTSVANKSPQFNRNDFSNHQISGQYISFESNVTFRNKNNKPRICNKNKFRKDQQIFGTKKHTAVYRTIQQSNIVDNKVEEIPVGFPLLTSRAELEAQGKMRKRDIMQGNHIMIKHHRQRLGPKNNKNKSSTLKTNYELESCVPNTGNKETKILTGNENHRKRSNLTKIHKGDDELSIKSDIIIKGLHHDKRCTRSVEYQLYTCIPNECDVIKYKSRAFKNSFGSKPKGDIKIRPYNESEMPLFVKKCACTVKGHNAHQKDVSTQQNEVNELKNSKSNRAKLHSRSLISKHTTNKDLETVLSHSKRKIKKNYQANIKSNNTSMSVKNGDGVSKDKNRGEKDSKPMDGTDNKKKEKNKNVAEFSNVDQLSSKSSKGRTKNLKTKHNILNSKCQNPQCSYYYQGDAEIKYKIPKGKGCSDSAINEKYYKHLINRKHKSKKKRKQNKKLDMVFDYQSLYPCTCSDTEINGKVYSAKNKNKDDALCPMCNHCHDSKKNLLLTILQENSTLVMEKINTVITTIKNKFSNTTHNTIIENEPLFEMLVNNEDMSIINKEDIIAEVKKSSKERTQHTLPRFQILLNKSDVSIINSDEIRNKVTKDSRQKKISDKRAEDFKIRKSPKRHVNYKPEHNEYSSKYRRQKKQKQYNETETINNYQGLYPCTCLDSAKQTNYSKNYNDKNNNDRLCPMCKECGDNKNNRLQVIGRLLMEKINEIFVKIKNKRDITEQSSDIRPLFEMLVNKDDMSVINKEHIIAKMKNSSDDRTQYATSPRFQMYLEKNGANIINSDEIRNKLSNDNKHLISQREIPMSHSFKENIIKSNKRHKNIELNRKPKPFTKNQGLYPCICSATKKHVDSGAGDKCCKDSKKNPLLALFHANSTSLMEKINKLLTKIKNQSYLLDVVPSTETKPLFEMVVNKGDMSIMNKEDIVTRVKRFSDGNTNPTIPHNFKMLIDKSDASIMNSDEIRNELMTSGQGNKISSNKIQDEIFKKSRVKGTNSKRQAYSFKVHGKNCNCCYCASKRQEKIIQSKISHKSCSILSVASSIFCKKGPLRPCICGSDDCKIASKEERQNRIEEKRRAKQGSCVCGSKICAEVIAVKNKLHASRNKDKKKTYKTKSKNKKNKAPRRKPDLKAIGPLLCGKIDFNEFKYRIQGKEESKESKRQRLRNEKQTRARKERLKRKKLYIKEDAKRRKARIKNDKKAMEEVKAFNDTPDLLLCAESIVDIGKLGLKTAAGVVRTTFRAVRDPKATWDNLKTIASDPDHAARSIKESIAGSGVGGTASRIKHRIGAMSTTKSFIAKMETNPVTNYMVHFADKDPKKRLARRGKRIREPLDFECSLFMGSLRKRPHLWVYYMCPWFYPHCISLLGMWRQFIDLILFLLAVAVWSPCIFAMEACRALMCCFLCTG